MRRSAGHRTRRGGLVAGAFALATGALLAATTPPPATGLRPGLWRFRNAPGTATLDGQAMRDLPAPPIVDETACLSPADAARPARWLVRDIAAECTLTQQAVGGRVAIRGTCPAPEEGGVPGSLSVTGSATPTRYQLRFATVANGENGRMGFSGTMTGHRVGECPATRP